MADELFEVDTTVDSSKDYLSELVGDGKKFATPADLARGKAEADAFIARITAENAQLREEVQKRKTVEEIRDQIVELQNTQTPPITPPNQRDERDEHNLFDQSKVDQIVSDRFEQLAREQQEKDNLQSVLGTLKNKFGPGYQAIVQSRADELGLGQKYLTDLAKTQPKAFLALVGETSQTAPERINTARSPSGLTTKKGWSHYEEIRKKDFHLYNTPAVQNEMFKALSEQGEDFYKT